jgi:hypothetical protein
VYVFAVTFFTAYASSDGEPAGTRSSFDLSKIDEAITKEFLKAWNYSHNGIDSVEGLVLIFRMLDGSYKAISLGPTNESTARRFQWDSAAIAVVHTHPTRFDPKPSTGDMQLSDRFGVPIFTITQSGMYMYDPHTKKTTKVQNNLDWLNASKWNRYSQSASAR